MNTPGAKEAEKLGFHLVSYSGPGANVTRADYCNDSFVHLMVYQEGEAELWAAYKLIQLRTGKFQFPHPRFDLFLRQMTLALAAVEYCLE